MRLICAFKYFLLICLPFLFSGCFYSLAGLDMSVEGRHQIWVDEHQRCIGQNTSVCRYWYRNEDNKPYPYYYLGTTSLINGHFEVGFADGKECHYYYEYEVDTGLIVGFRFEESDKYTCRITGA